MRYDQTVSTLVCGLLVLGLSGCVTQRGRPPSLVDAEPSAVRSPELVRAEALFQSGRYSDAIVAVSEISRLDPLAPGLPELQARIMRTLSEERLQASTRREANTQRRLMGEVLAQNVLPDTYQLKRNVRGETSPLRSAPSRMQEALSKNVTVHLENVDLAAFAAQIAESQGINIIADGNLGGSGMTLHAEDTPLIEILEYVGRNLGVTFSVGNNLIWATRSQEAQGTLPLETRIYRLRKGLAGEELSRPQAGGGSPGEGPAMIEVIGRFVPQAEGSDILFNPKAHVLVVRNTRENLDLAEDLIAALDITPPQVLIEARFVSATVDNLSELGVDWIMDSPYAVSTVRQGVKTQIAPGASIAFPGFPNAAQGLNFTFQGVLTDPQFRAIVHILESSGKAQTLSVPRVTTINNRPATIRVGEDFRYYEEYDLEDVRSSTTTEGTDRYEARLVPVGRPTLEELGIELSATPSIGADLSSINLALLPEISEFVRWEYYEVARDNQSASGNGDGSDLVSGGGGLIKLPVFRRSRIETEVVVRSGETVVMGGLITNTQSRQQDGVPFLSKLPFLGQLFRHNYTQELRQNLIIFVTATLISEVGEELIPLSEFQVPDHELHDGVGASPLPEVLEQPPADSPQEDILSDSPSVGEEAPAQPEAGGPAVEEPAPADVEA